MSRQPIRGVYLANDFIISAGCVLLKREAGKPDRIVFLHKRRGGDHVLPKGRQDIGESIPETAIRETYEETGYKCRLLPLKVPSLAPNAKDHPINVQPIAITLKFDGMSRPGKHIQKFVHWYVGVVEDGVQRVEGTQVGNEDYEVRDVELERAEEEMTSQDDKELILLTKKLIKEQGTG